MKFSLTVFDNSIAVPLAVEPLRFAIFWGRCHGRAPAHVPEQTFPMMVFIPSPMDRDDIAEAVQWANTNIEAIRREIRAEMIKPHWFQLN